MNAARRQAGVPALKHEDFIKTEHVSTYIHGVQETMKLTRDQGKTNMALPPWSVENLESETPKCPLTLNSSQPTRILAGIKVLELCRIIAGPIITRILGEYGADVLKITSPNLSDVPFFQVDGNMGKHAAELDLKSSEGRAEFDRLLAEADVVVDGYRPGALEKLGYGATALTELAKKRGKGFVYVNENCFGYEGEWAGRPGWQQIADCVSDFMTITRFVLTTIVGKRHRLGTRSIHGLIRARGPSFPYIRLRNRLHRCYHSIAGPLPPSYYWRIMAWQSLTSSLRPLALQGRPVPRRG
jgi:hypothetical protein